MSEDAGLCCRFQSRYQDNTKEWCHHILFFFLKMDHSMYILAGVNVILWFLG